MSSMGSQFKPRRGEAPRDWQDRLGRVCAAGLTARRLEEWTHRLVLAARVVRREALEQPGATAGHVIAPVDVAAFTEYRLADAVRVGP